MEDPNTFEDMDDILTYYSDSPVLGRLNESHTHSEFAFDEGDWEPEVILGFETKLKVYQLFRHVRMRQANVICSKIDRL
ncbi:hypothetical protein HHX47_DHR1000940 [Lentinula edodes]|nr:hypothetical protein HHX47_DHR1000940 [Lentinula edodes]